MHGMSDQDEQVTYVNCSRCEGQGWYTEHSPDCTGENCGSTCPIQMNCQACQSKGWVLNPIHYCGCQCDNVDKNCRHDEFKMMRDNRCAHCGYKRKDLPPDFIPEGAYGAKLLPDGRRVVLYDTIMNGGRYLIGPANDNTGGDEEYMFENFTDASVKLDLWDGYGEPDGWIRHKIGNQTRRRVSDGSIRFTSD